MLESWYQTTGNKTYFAFVVRRLRGDYPLTRRVDDAISWVAIRSDAVLVEKKLNIVLKPRKQVVEEVGGLTGIPRRGFEVVTQPSNVAVMPNNASY